VQAALTRRPRRPLSLSIGRGELTAMVAGAALYAALSWSTNVFHMEAAAEVQIRPGVAVPIFFGLVYGPIVGFFVGAAGNFAGDLVSGLIPYALAVPQGDLTSDTLRAYLVNWQVGNGLMGLIPGLAAMYYRRYFSLTDQLRALAVIAVAVVVGIGFAACTHPWVDGTVSLDAALSLYFLPIVKVNLINAAVIVPVLLFNYERFDVTSTDWLASGLMRRLLVAILVSAALPVALLGLFLTQQTTGGSSNTFELMGKLVFTVILSLLFTVANAGLVGQSMSRPLLGLTEAARLMQEGRLGRDQAARLQAVAERDEIGYLSHMFGRMSLEVISREEALRQQVAELRIEIDEAKKSKQVEEITDSEYFKSLQERAQRMRGRRDDR
jgi:hypothetical protein